MAAGNKAASKKAGAPSFDSIIEAERLNRKKKENQTLADQLLGSKKNRRASAPGPGIGNKKAPAERTLASRIGVAKRSASTSAKPKSTTITTAARAATSKRPVPASSRRTREDRMLADINGKKDVNLNIRNPGISIKGSGTGPFVVMGRNFAPGTNAADIEAALEPVAGHIVGVHITSHAPYVSAQIACAEKWGADAIVTQFNGQKADGRVLSLEYKGAGNSFFNAPAVSRAASNNYDYDAFREQADRERRESRKAESHGKAEPHVQDGKSGPNDSKGRRKRGDGRANGTTTTKGLYSDDMMVDAPVVPISQRGRGFR